MLVFELCNTFIKKMQEKVIFFLPGGEIATARIPASRSPDNQTIYPKTE